MVSPIPEFFGAPVDPALLDSAARLFIVMATRQARGSLWKVQWEFDLPVRLDLDLADLLEAAVQRFLSLEAVWEPNIRQLVWDYEVADNLGAFP